MTERETSMTSDVFDRLPISESPVISVPDRADAPVSEVTERFLRAVIAKVPLDRIEELHLFAPLRQGGVETGIAVVAARVPVPTPPAAAESDLPTEAVALPPDALDSPDDSDSPDDPDLANGVANVALDAEPESPYLDEVPTMPADAGASEEPGSVVAPPAASLAEPAPPIVRHTVYTARYRLVLKGPERGQWEADVVDEADAPLITVETVVRGVQRRAGEETEILRYSDRQIARALRLSWPVHEVASTIAATV